MPKKELTPEQAIEQATKDVADAMKAHIAIVREEKEIGKKKIQSHYALQKARERLTALGYQLME